MRAIRQQLFLAQDRVPVKRVTSENRPGNRRQEAGQQMSPEETAGRTNQISKESPTGDNCGPA
jgi:hypothetical protein